MSAMEAMNKLREKVKKLEQERASFDRQCANLESRMTQFTLGESDYHKESLENKDHILPFQSALKSEEKPQETGRITMKSPAKVIHDEEESDLSALRSEVAMYKEALRQSELKNLHYENQVDKLSKRVQSLEKQVEVVVRDKNIKYNERLVSRKRLPIDPHQSGEPSPINGRKNGLLHNSVHSYYNNSSMLDHSYNSNSSQSGYTSSENNSMINNNNFEIFDTSNKVIARRTKQQPVKGDVTIMPFLTVSDKNISTSFSKYAYTNILSNGDRTRRESSSRVRKLEGELNLMNMEFRKLLNLVAYGSSHENVRGINQKLNELLKDIDRKNRELKGLKVKE